MAPETSWCNTWIHGTILKVCAESTVISSNKLIFIWMHMKDMQVQTLLIGDHKFLKLCQTSYRIERMVNSYCKELFPKRNMHPTWCRPTFKLPITPTQLPIHHCWSHTMPSLFVRQCVACAHVVMIGMQRTTIGLTSVRQTNLNGNSYEMRR